MDLYGLEKDSGKCHYGKCEYQSGLHVMLDVPSDRNIECALHRQHHGRCYTTRKLLCKLMKDSIFPPKEIRQVGTFQDAGPLENDPLLSADAAFAKLHPHLKRPDFVLSLGTGEPAEDESRPMSTQYGTWGKGALFRMCRLAWEKMRDTKLRHSLRNHSRYLRLDLKVDGPEPRLDDVGSMLQLERRALDDSALLPLIDETASRAVASLFYFELANRTEAWNDRYIGEGHIYCTLCSGHAAYRSLMDYISNPARGFFLDGVRVPFHLASCLNRDGRFALPLSLKVHDEFRITFKHTEESDFHISASPFSISSLESVQGLTTSWGRPGRKRGRCNAVADRPAKRVCR